MQGEGLCGGGAAGEPLQRLGAYGRQRPLVEERTTISTSPFFSFFRLTTHGSGEAVPRHPVQFATGTLSWYIGILLIFVFFGISDLSSTNLNRSGSPGENVWPMVIVET